MTEEEMIAYQGSVISRILDAPFEEAIRIYASNFQFLQEYSFILPHSDGMNYVQKFRELNLADMDVIHFFGSETLYCLNSTSFMSIMCEEDYELLIASLVSLDTQIQSYLYRYYLDKTSRVPENISEIKKIIRSHMCLIDGLAYTFENALFNPDFLTTQICKDNAFALETYFFDDKKEAAAYADYLLCVDDRLFHDKFSDWLRHQYLLYYLELLVMTDLQLNSKNLSLDQKELRFVQYFHEVVHIVSDREVNLAILFFKYGTDIKFFGKIQKGKRDIVQNLKNMAWDIFHLRNTFNNLAIIPPKADFIIPFFITYDQRLKDIVPIYKLKSAAFIKNTSIKHLNFLTDLMSPSIKHDYFTHKAYMERQKWVKDETEQSIIAKLRMEIEKYEKVLG